MYDEYNVSYIKLCRYVHFLIEEMIKFIIRNRYAEFFFYDTL